MTGLDRSGERSIGEQIAAVIERAIGEAELMPGEKLPSTRELAELAGVNHLTASRAYRRLADRGSVVSRVGAGTFVRGSAALAHEEPPPGSRGSTTWQHYLLREPRSPYADSILLEVMRATANADDVIPMITGYPSERIFPAGELARMAAAAAAEQPELAWQYAPPEGMAELREAFAAHHRRYGLEADPEQVIVTNGARQALLHVARAIAAPGEVVACESPSFAGIISALGEAGLEVLPVPVDADGLRLDALELLLRHHEIKLLVLQPRLQNPTGRDLSTERRRGLVELARRHGFFVVEDAIYARLRFEGEDPGPLRALAPEHVVLVDSVSKVVAPGLRAGCAIASGPVLERIAQQKRNDDLASPSLPQLVAARFLGSPAWEEQIERSIDFHRERRDCLLEAIERRLEGLARPAYVPLGGGHVWVELARALDERQLYEEAIRQGVSFMPAGASMAQAPEHPALRLSFSYLEPDRIDEGVRRLAAALREGGWRPAPRRVLPIA